MLSLRFWVSSAKYMGIVSQELAINNVTMTDRVAGSGASAIGKDGREWVNNDKFTNQKLTLVESRLIAACGRWWDSRLDVTKCGIFFGGGTICFL